MAVSSTYGQMQSAIADELGGRSDLATQIQNAIQSAIAKWERERFYFNEVWDQNGFSTSNGQEIYGASTSPVSYALIASMAQIDKVHVLVSSNRYTLNPRTWQYLEDTSVNPAVVGQPVDYAYYANQLRFYPIPDNAYPITLSGTQRLPTLAATGDANAWTQDAEALIRSEAKKILADEILFDSVLSDAMHKAIYGNPADPRSRGYLDALKAETTRRGAGGRIRPTYF